MWYKIIFSIMVITLNYFILKLKIDLKLFYKVLLSVLFPIVIMYGFKIVSGDNYSATLRFLCFVLSLSFGLIWLKLIFEFIGYFMNLNIFSIKEKGQETKKYFEKITTIIMLILFPILVTIFQLILIWGPEKIEF